MNTKIVQMTGEVRFMQAISKRYRERMTWMKKGEESVPLCWYVSHM